MYMENFNSIGIDGRLDWARVKKLLTIGFIASLMVFAGDFILGYGTADESLDGMKMLLSAYVNKSDRAIFWSSFLGFVGITLSSLCYFGIYRLMAERSPKCAHLYRAGIFGYMMFGACGVHVMMLACLFCYKHFMAVTGDFGQSIEIMIKFASYFLLPSFIVFMIFFVIFCTVQIVAFAKGYTPYPKWCLIFNVFIGMMIAAVITAFGHSAFMNALSAAYMGFGNIWTFGGLLVMMNKAKENSANT